MPPSSPASSEGSTGMVPYSLTRIRGSVSRRDRRMMNFRSTKEELRVRRKSLELRVSVDVGYRRHSVAMGLSSGEVLEEFEIDHRPEGFQDFFARIEKHRKTKDCRVAVAMEGYNGHARPLDSLVRE